MEMKKGPIRQYLLVLCLALSPNDARGLASRATTPTRNADQLTLEGLKELLRDTITIRTQSTKLATLSSRLPLDLDRTYIQQSRVAEDAGRGLFASRDCQKGELLTCYPGDVLVLDPTTDLSDLPTHNNIQAQAERRGDDSDNDDSLIVWGSHVPESSRVISEALCTSYILEVPEDAAIVGLPELDQDMSYAGHFCNDGVRAPPRKESQIASYVLESNELANAMHISLEDGSHMATVATRDISKDEEILVTYGPEYWMEQSTWNDDDTVVDVDSWRSDDELFSIESNGMGFG